MRKILFRAWDRENQCYHTPIYNAIEGQLEELLINHNGRLAMWCMKGLQDESIFPDRFELEQFTGLTDRNGKGIYEGDVIRYENDLEYGNGTIEFNCGFNIIWDLKTVKTNNPTIQSPLFYFQCSSEFEIIGNIHDKTNENA